MNKREAFKVRCLALRRNSAIVPILLDLRRRFTSPLHSYAPLINPEMLTLFAHEAHQLRRCDATLTPKTLP